jgi:DNA-binding GntR family transcriptional regulator
LQTLRLESTPAMVAERVRAGILDGTLLPGSQLTEIDLAAQLGVSRGPVREALQRLINEGLVRSERNRGVFVVDLGIADATDVYFVRSVVERAAATALARHPDEDVLAGLALLVDRMDELQGEPWADLVDLDLEFHRMLVHAAGSERLDRIFNTLSAEARLCLLYLEPFYPDRCELVEEHREFIEAIRAGDPAVLEGVVDRHMDAAVGRITSGGAAPADGRDRP